MIRIDFEIIEGVCGKYRSCVLPLHRRTEIAYVAFIFLLVHLFGGFIAVSRFSIRVWGIQRSPFSLLSAPLCVVFLLATVSILNSALGLFTSSGFIMVELLCIAIAVAVIGAIARSRFDFAFTVPDLPAFKVVIFALAFSFAIAIYNYVIPLDGPFSFAQDSDNSFIPYPGMQGRRAIGR